MKTLKNSNIRLGESSSGNILERILEHRGLSSSLLEASSFFQPTISDLHDPFLFPGMQEAVERILLARDQKERVVVFGDYDVDGVSSTAILVRFFKEIGIEASYRLPHRVKDGYGMKPYFMDELAEKWVKLVVSVDCGTRDIATVTHAKTLWIDVIVTDHHAVPEIIPEWLIALLNPKLPGTTYPFHSLAGSGVAFKLLQALTQTLHPQDTKKQEIILSGYLDFACLGTIADCMPLIDENRTIAILGLKQIKNSRSSGLRKLTEWRLADADLVGFHIGPRINAAGRMDTPYTALSLLLSWEDRADLLLEEIELLNTKRKASVEYFLTEALNSIDSSMPIIFYESDAIEHGIIGLIAGRLAEAFGKPAIALKREENKLVASCRANEWFDIVEILENSRELFVAFGGHKQAAGFTIEAKNFEAFKARSCEFTKNHPSYTRGIIKSILIDQEFHLDDINITLAEKIASIGPYGIGFEKPAFLVTIPRPVPEPLGKDGRHLKIQSLGFLGKINAFGFGEFHSEIANSSTIKAICEISKEAWRGKTSVVLTIKDIVQE